MDSLIGKEIDQYIIVDQWYQDDFFEYYKALHKNTQQPVILQKYISLPIQESEIMVHRHAISQMSSIKHESFLNFIKAVRKEDTICFFYDFADGVFIHEYAQKKGPSSETNGVLFFKRLLKILIDLKAQGFVHQSLSPYHILIKNEHIYVLPFTFYVDKDIDIKYHAPENHQGIQGNIYTLGIILFEILTGKSPFYNIPKDQLREQMLKGKFPKASSFYPGVFEKVERIIEKAVAVKAEERFETYKDFFEAFEQESIFQVPIKKEKKVVKLAHSLYVLAGLVFIIVVLVIYISASNQTKNSIILEVNSKKDYQTPAVDSVTEKKPKKIKQLPPKDTLNMYVYKVKSGDNLSKIAQCFHVKVKDIKKYNHLKTDIIDVGMGLKVPIRDIYVVNKGETLWNIAKAFHVKIDDLLFVNDIENAKKDVFEGRELIIPLP